MASADAQEASPPGPSTATSQQCTATFQGAVQDLFACLRNVDALVSAAIREETTKRLHKWEDECVKEGVEDTQYYCWILKNNLGDLLVHSSEFVESHFKDYAQQCETKFRQAYNDTKRSCAGAGNVSSIRSTYCLATKTAASTCADYCGGDSNCKQKCDTWIPPPSGSDCNPKIMRHAATKMLFGCDAEVSPIVEPICAACSNASDPEGCKKNCAALTNQLMAACEARHSSDVPTDSKNAGNKNVGKKTSITSGKVQSGGANATKVKSGLDRFDLGPNFATPSTVNTGTGTRARSGGGGGSPKTTTTVAPGVTDQPTKLNVLPGN
jgi:hypothetical protein